MTRRPDSLETPSSAPRPPASVMLAPAAGAQKGAGEAPTESLDAQRRFIASVSHELRTPLNGILGLAALLAETPLSAVQADYLSAIRSSGARLLDLLNNVLDYSRLEADALVLEAVRFDPVSLAQDVAELLAPRAHAAGLDLAVVRRGPCRAVTADEGRIRQILFNLVGNAIKFTETGSVRIEIDQTDPLRLIARVVDTGPGVPEEARGRLFQAFSQSLPEHAQKGSGVGLGLAISARLAEALGGTLSLEDETGPDRSSPTGGGAVFRFEMGMPEVPGPVSESDADHALSGLKVALLGLPAASHAAAEASLIAAGATVSGPEKSSRNAGPKPGVRLADASLPRQTLKAAIAEGPTLVLLRPEDRALIPDFAGLGASGYLIRPIRPASLIERVQIAASGGIASHEDERADATRTGARVLVADDNPVNALLATRALEQEGFKVDRAATGAEAVSAAADTAYDLILMDIRMPVMDGFEATRRIRSDPGPSRDAAILAVTADIDPELEARARAVGMTAWAAKPLDPVRLRALARQHTRPAPTGGTTQNPPEADAP
jgi:CheY-like chemotaxis protein